MCFYFDEKNQLSIAVLKYTTCVQLPCALFSTTPQIVKLGDSIKWVIHSLQIVSQIQTDI